MRALRLYGARDARLEEVDEPGLRPGTVKVRVAWAGICGSDLLIYERGPFPLDAVNPVIGERGPRTLGHEFSGYVEAVAEDVVDVEVGALVAVQPNVADGTCAACRAGHPNLCENGGFIGVHGWGGGFSEVVVIPADRVVPVPDELGADTAALIEPLGVAWHAVKLAGDVSSALVLGAGPIGLAIVLALRARGVSTIIVSEPSAARKRLASELGADLVIDPREQDLLAGVAMATGSGGVAASFDASGVGAATLQPAIDALGPAGRAVIVATFHEPVPLDVGPLMTREKTLLGSFAYTRNDFVEVRDALVQGRLVAGPLISSRIALADILDRGIVHLLGEGRCSEVKILVDPTIR